MRTFMFFDTEADEHRGTVVDIMSSLTNYEIIKRHIHIDEDGDVVFKGYPVNHCLVLIRHTPEDTEGHFLEYKIGKVCGITVN